MVKNWFLIKVINLYGGNKQEAYIIKMSRNWFRTEMGRNGFIRTKSRKNISNAEMVDTVLELKVLRILKNYHQRKLFWK